MIKKKEKDWFKDRGYFHFSNKTPKSIRNNILKYVSNPEKVSKHSFSPLIFKEIKQRRYKESDFNGVSRRSHKKLKEGKIISNAKIREILYATHIDAHVYSYYSQKIITLKYESYLRKNELLSDSITAYRRIETKDKVKFKNNGHFDEKKLAKNRKNGKYTFFDKIDELLNSDIIIHKNQKKNKNKELIGIPQGLPISALLANIYMLAFDETIINELTLKHNIFYRRYSDDIVVLCKENEINLVEDFIINQVAKIDLKISKEKTEKTLFKIHNNRLQYFKINKDNSLQKNVPLNYLGFEFYGYQTLIKSKNLAQFYREMKQTVKRKHKRVEHIKEKFLLDEAPLFKRKLYRLYSFKGVKSRKLPSKKTHFANGTTVTEIFERKYRGNYLRYAYRASDDLNAPEIKRQLRNHWKILQNTMKKYDFSNVKNED